MKTNWCFLKKAVSVCPGFCAFPLRSSPAPLCLLSVCLSLPLRLSAILPANFIGRSCAHRSHMALISQVSPSCVHYRNCPQGGQSLPRVFFFYLWVKYLRSIQFLDGDPAFVLPALLQSLKRLIEEISDSNLCRKIHDNWIYIYSCLYRTIKCIL